MTIVEGVSLSASVASIVRACVAIFYAFQTDKKSSHNYERTGDLLTEIGKKAEVKKAHQKWNSSRLPPIGLGR